MNEKMKENHQGIYVKIMAVFFAAVLFMTFFSKTFYNKHLPVVQVGLPMTGELDHSVEASARVSKLEQGQWKLELMVDETAADKVDKDSQVSININGRQGHIEGSITAIDFYQKEDGTQGYMITVEFACEDESVEGKKADVKMQKAEEVYDGIVPSLAVHKDMKGYYVWSIREEENVLGKHAIVVRVSVDYLDADDTHTAVMGLTENMAVIISAPEGVTAGDEVRYEIEKPFI